ncbi:protein TonB [Algoriphagus boseongensis]|uniref:Protein TonB n=1 Tax=Algoriphagus boseongensis TaxID=1442587 RepID=A0A4R6T412_9BACT|nr:energy transducer TonB [Algoriphagus boseongensis]TDQ16492.1 protein TonB [Algoriphagus boseongensis]
METKKNPKKEVHRWTHAFFSLGLMISVGAVLVAFEWKSYEEKPILEFENGILDLNDFEVPITIQEPPRQPDPIQIPKFEEIEDDEAIEDKITFDLNISPETEIPEIKLDDQPPVIDKGDEIYDYTEVQASFKGGMDAWYAYLKKNLSYPKLEQRAGIEGTVFIRFVINLDGSIEDAEVVRSAGEGLDNAAMQVILNSPKWEPGRFRGRPVRSRMTIPIRFKLQ